MRQRNAIILAVVLSVVAVFVVVPLAMGAATNFGAWLSIMEQTKYIDENFENPIVRSDGVVMERSDPCAFSQDLAKCREMHEMAKQRNQKIDAKNMESYLSVPQHEDPTVSPRWNYWYLESMQLLEKSIAENDCDFILLNVKTVADYWEVTGPTNHSEGDNKLILDSMEQYEQAGEKYCK